MITFEHVSVQYADAPAPSLHDVTLGIPEGELVLVVGPTGSGKSTLLRTINGLAPGTNPLRTLWPLPSHAMPSRTSIGSTCAPTSRAGQKIICVPSKRRSRRRSTCCNPPITSLTCAQHSLYPVTTLGYRALYEEARLRPQARRRELIDVALQGRERRDELRATFAARPTSSIS